MPASSPLVGRALGAIIAVAASISLSLVPAPGPTASASAAPVSAAPVPGARTVAAEEGGSVSGVIRRSEEPGHPIGGYSVQLDPYSTATTTSYSTTADEQGRFSITGVAPGTYLVKVGSPTETYYMTGNADRTEFGGGRSWTSQSETGISADTVIVADFFVPFQSFPLQYERERIAGSDRYDTAARMSQYAFLEPTPVAFIASGENFPDALSAAPAAAQLDAPLLLTMRDALPASVAAELGRLQTQRAIVVGGTSVVSDDVVRQLEALGIAVERIAGADRYETSIAIARRVFPWCSGVNVATGWNFPDALALSATGGPLLLVDGGAAALRGDVRQAILDMGCTDARIAGGTAVVSAGIESELRGMLPYGAARFAGSDRYETARRIADKGQVQNPHVFLASGSNFPDALAAASYAARIFAPLYLAHWGCVPTASAQQIEDGDVAVLTVVGGESVLSGSTEHLYPC